MLELTDPVSAIPKIGPKFKMLLEKLEIYNVEDLLYHFPFRYDDYSEVKNIADIQVGETATIQANLGDVKNIFTKYGKRLTQAQITDLTGKMDIVWFNSHYLKKTLKPGEKYNFSGKINLFNKKPAMFAPNFELIGEHNLSTGRLVAIYPETTGLSSKWLRQKISDVLQNSAIIEEFLPKDILNAENLPDITKALKQIHFPRGMVEVNHAVKRFQIEELLLELLKVAERKALWGQNLKAIVINSLIYEDKLDNLIRSLDFELSTSQKQAIEEIKHEMKKPHPMNRLLEGDVGTGKTLVAVVAAYLTHLNNLNVLYMAPTEILAKQHYETFKKYLEPLGVSVHLNTSAKKTEIKEKAFILIGTHALLYNGKYENAGLVVIDEQQRFGVEQRTQLARTNGNYTPHLLTMTATPIPRTLALTLYGDLEISQLQPIPGKDKRINTKVIPEKLREQQFEWIRKQNKQTFIVCPFIEESEHEDFENVKAATAEFEKLRKGVFADLSVGLLHGKMSNKEKYEVVEKFEREEIKVLVSTPVIEVGIDIPEASIMVIESAERYGLASLHQLRGRIGRKGQEGYCFIFMSSNSRDAYSRLKYLEEINNGLLLAEKDLQIRGHGDIYGTMQSGFKKLKIARLSDLKMLEKAKKYAEEYFNKLDRYPLLKKKLYDRAGQYVGNN